MGMSLINQKNRCGDVAAPSDHFEGREQVKEFQWLISKRRPILRMLEMGAKVGGEERNRARDTLPNGFGSS